MYPPFSTQHQHKHVVCRCHCSTLSLNTTANTMEWHTLITLLIICYYVQYILVNLLLSCSTAEKEALQYSEGNAGGTDQIGPNGELEEVECNVCGQKEY